MGNRLVAMATMGLVCALAGSAWADTTFDFEGTASNPLGTNSDSTAISNYMSEVYGNTVTVTDARANPSSSSSDWASTGDSYQNDTGFIQAVSGNDFEIAFSGAGISAVRFTGFIDDASTGSDFSFQAYTSAYDDAYLFLGFIPTQGSAENPAPGSDDVSRSWEADQVDPNGQQENVAFDSGWIYFNAPVNLLVFHDSGSYDVAIDDLRVRTVPLPAAAWMGFMMLGCLGLARRRRRTRDRKSVV